MKCINPYPSSHRYASRTSLLHDCLHSRYLHSSPPAFNSTPTRSMSPGAPPCLAPRARTPVFRTWRRPSRAQYQRSARGPPPPRPTRQTPGHSFTSRPLFSLSVSPLPPEIRGALNATVFLDSKRFLSGVAFLLLGVHSENDSRPIKPPVE